jgi:NAD(P)-dependent dehydrogenase (short-subunit alcohol dehydrogenase family)
MKTAIVTGATGNLGQAVVSQLIADGFIVHGTVMDPAKVDYQHANFIPVTADLADEDASSKMVHAVIEHLGSVDVAVLTVGGYAAATIEKTSTADISKQIQLNFDTAYNVARPVFLQMMKQGSGRIFLVGSRPGLAMTNSKGMVAYGLSKSLIFRLAELMNEEAKGQNVVVSVIIPSTIDTPQNRSAMPNVDPSKWVTAEEIATLVSFYSGEQAKQLREPLIKIYGQS